MKKARRFLVLGIAAMLILAFAVTAFALDTNYSGYRLQGSCYISGATIGGSLTVTQNQHLSTASLSCSVSGTGYNGVGSVVGTYAGSNTVQNNYTVTASGSGTCYVYPASVIPVYTFKGKTWTD